MSKYLRQLAGESIVYGLSGTAAKAIGIFLMPLYTRAFAPADYGVIALVDSLIYLLTIIACLGMGNSAVRWYYDSAESTDRRTTFSCWVACQLTISSAITVGILAASPHISTWLFRSEAQSVPLRWAALAIPLSVVVGVSELWFRLQRRPWAAVGIGLANTFCSIGLVVVFVLILHRGVPGLYEGRLVAAIAYCAVAVISLSSWISIRSFSLGRLKDMLKFALPFVPASIALWLMQLTDRFVLAAFHGPDEVGLLSTAGTIASAVSLVVSAFIQAWTPFAFSISKEPEAPEVYARVFELYVYLGCCLCVAIASFGPLFLRLLTTDAYYTAAPCIKYLVFGLLASGASSIGSLGCSLRKRSMPITVSVGMGATLNIGMAFALVPRFGKEGAAIATLVAYLFSTLVVFTLSQRCHYIPYRWGVALACGMFSIAIIALTDYCPSETSFSGAAIRVLLILLFIPLGVAVGITRWRSLRELYFRLMPAG